MDGPGKSFDFERDIFPAELGEIGRRRLEIERRRRRLNLERQLERKGADPAESELRRKALEEELASLQDPFEGRERTPSPQLGLVGLAISGGGIRSATSALGVIQALAQKDLLQEVDYLSTVSGGGFIGSCLSSVLNDPRAATTQAGFPLASDPGRKEHPALGHLRNASRYLAPGGLLDKLRIPALLFRGILNNFAIFLLLIMVLVMVTEVIYQLAWKYEVDLGDTLLVALLGFALLPMIFPLAVRLSKRPSWDRRNLSGQLISVWLLVLLVAVALIPIAMLVDAATRINLAELRTILIEEFRAPFEPRDSPKWLALVAITLLFLSAARASQTVAKLRSRLVLLAIGLLGPAILLAVYLGFIVSELDAGFIASKRLFAIAAADVGYLAPGKEQEARPRIQDHFAKNGIQLAPSFSLGPVDGARWVISDGNRAYSLTRDGDELHVEHDFLYPLGSGDVSPALREALGEKGHTLSQHVQVIPYTAGERAQRLSFPRKLLFKADTAELDPAAMEEIGKLAAYANARPTERLRIVGVSAPGEGEGKALAMARARAVAAGLGPQRRARLDLSQRSAGGETTRGPDAGGWVEIHAKQMDAGGREGVTEGTFYLSGNREIAIIPHKSRWTVGMVVHPTVVTQALQRASSMFNRFVSWPLYTPIRGDASFADDDIDAALRFVKEGRQQDIVLVIDETPSTIQVETATGTASFTAGPGLEAKVMQAINAAASSAVVDRDPLKSMQLVVLRVRGKQRAFYQYRPLTDVASGAQRGEPVDPALVERACDWSLPPGPAALLCGMRSAEVTWRRGAEKSVWFVGFGSALWSGPEAYRNWAARMRDINEVKLHAMAVWRGGAPDCGGTAEAQGSGCNFVRPLADYRGAHGVVKDEDALLWLEVEVARRLQSYAIRSPQRASLRLRDQSSSTESYTLFREGSRVRVEADVTAARWPFPVLPALDQDDRAPQALYPFLAAAGMYLSPHAYVTKSPPPATSSYPDHPCMDAARMAWRKGCVQIHDPHLLEVRRVQGGLRVREIWEQHAWAAWLPSSLVWSGEVQWKWTIVLICLVAYWFWFNVNFTSLNRFYRDRLSRAYLFGIDRRKGKRRRGELYPNDGQKLSRLNRDGSAAPYHLINVALNLADSRAEDLRGRNADFFLFSKHFTGSPRTGYVPTATMEKCDPHLDLGTAMTISGAAAAPNMGTGTLKVLVLIMTLLNIRLGYWLPNPRAVARPGALKRVTWRLGPGPTYLLREALARVHERGDYVYLSDGGHIENLGIYELLRRRCKCIIAIDGEADPELRFQGLMILMRYARIDLGINIEFDLEPLLDDIRRSGESGMSRHCWAVGRIDYGGGEAGRLYYIKSAVTGNEPDYVKDYRSRFPSFPHESTAEQFFNESQFEAYRALGEHIGKCVAADDIRAFMKGNAAA